MKLRLLSRTWPNISKKLEHTVYKKVQMAESCQNKKMEKQKKTKKVSESLGWDTPPSKESRNIVFFVFPRFLPSVGYFKETGMNHRQSCQSALGNAVKHPKISS